ncbi:RAMP superfamily CRISPR-associated protein [uncultured Actinomyces sp.]|uniref:RAMP superfamily CRISPR-associated protein n=1 Tax=uncultured Actinomyces sp. TaxID=249061 RepID=UPI00288A8ED6|nr:RAMP superfamily CRISPR-associated protein [uncultured Actinomyces sp.]
MSITRYELTVCLRTDSPLHSGGIDEAVDRTRPSKDRETVPRRFARDGADHPVLTGRSVKGAVRAACKKYFDETRDSHLWGGLSAQGAWASALTFHTVDLHDAEVFPGRGDGPGGASGLPTRMGIAIDRYWGAAGDTALFEHEYVPAGRPLTLTITAQAGSMPENRPGDPGAPFGGVSKCQPVTEDDVERLFSIILGVLKSERVSFGGRRNAGWGRVRPDMRPGSDKFWVLTRAPLGTRDDLLSWLGNGCGEDMSTRIKPIEFDEPDRVRINIDWDSPTGILVADPRLSRVESARNESDEDEAPENNTKATKEGGKTTREAEPGGERNDSRDEDDPDEFIPTRHLRSGPGENDPIVLPGSSVRGALRSRASRIARTILAARRGSVDDWSNIGVHDRLAHDPDLVRRLFGSTKHRGALTVLDTLAASNGSTRLITHNAGDRWTGGVAGGTLYGEEVHDATWKNIVLELDLEVLFKDDNRRRAAWCLLGLVLAELAAGTLPLGSRGTRGLGQVEVAKVAVTGGRSIGIEDRTFSAPSKGAGESVAKQILSHLRMVNKGITASPGASGWSSYLMDEEKNHG